MLLTVSNLFPRPDRPQMGMFNAQLFAEFQALLAAGGGRLAGEAGTASRSSVPPLLNVCLVPEWRVWQWGRIRQWTAPASATVPTVYMPAFYVPRLGRDWMAATYYRSLARRPVTFRDTSAVFATWLYPDGVAAARLADELGVPCWIMVQGSDVFHLQYPRRLKALMDVSPAIQGFICVCGSLADRLVGAGIHRSRTRVVPNGVDATRFRYRSKPEAAGGLAACDSGARLVDGGRDSGAGANVERLIPELVAGRRKAVLFVGNLVHVKGPDLFLRSLALATSAARGPAPLALVIGDGPMRAGLEQEARRLGLRDRVVFLGSRPHAEVPYWMNLADVLCLASRSEGMPNVVIEALVSGLPVVVTSVGACREMVEGEPDARLCLPGDGQGLARAIDDLVASPCDRKALAARHAERYSWTRQARTILDLMEKSPGW